MTIPALNGQLGDLLAARNQPAARPADRPAVGDGSATNAAANVQVASLAAKPRESSSLTVQAPPGTDPELWSILTSEERAFFSRQALSGPLTYLKVMMPNATSAAPSMAAARGRRLDVRA